jgi:hypothetical protein
MKLIIQLCCQRIMNLEQRNVMTKLPIVTSLFRRFLIHLEYPQLRIFFFRDIELVFLQIILFKRTDSFTHLSFTKSQHS